MSKTQLAVGVQLIVGQVLEARARGITAATLPSFLVAPHDSAPHRNALTPRS